MAPSRACFRVDLGLSSICRSKRHKAIFFTTIQYVNSIHQAAMAPPPIVSPLYTSCHLALIGHADTLTPPLPHVQIQAREYHAQTKLISAFPTECYAVTLLPAIRFSTPVQLQLYPEDSKRECHARYAILLAPLETASPTTCISG